MKYLAIVFFTSSLAMGHARIAANSEVVPRNNNPGLKVGPCGNVPRTATPKILTPGQKVIIRWEETINHPGSYFIEFSPANEQNWVRLKTYVDDKNGTNDLPHQYQEEITVPNTLCDTCTIRLVQEMTDRNPPTYYYSCGDIQIKSGSNEPPPTGQNPGAEPVPDQYGGDDVNTEGCSH